MSAAINMTGLTVHGCTVIDRAGVRGGKVLWNCRCDCGAHFQAVGTSLRSQNSSRCPACAKDSVVAAATKHGFVGTAEYNSYSAMKQRCYDPCNKRYARYGGRGIDVCARWLESFSNFLEDMGPKPSPEYSVERKNGDGNYEPSNCVWATRAEQANNRSNNTLIQINGRTQTMTQWSRESGINRTVILRRLQRGFTGALLIQKGILK